MSPSIPLARLAFGCVADADDSEGLEDVKRHTHDHVVDDLGDRRDGPVEWSIYDAPVGLERIALLKEIDGGDYSGLEGFLRDNPSGLLVVASAYVKVGTP